MNNQLSIDRRRPFVWIALLLLATLVTFLVASCNGGDSKPVQNQSVVIPLNPPIEGSDFTLPPADVKALVARGITYLAAFDENDTVRGVVSLHADGTCQTCKYIGATSDEGKPAYPNSPNPQQQGQNDVLPFPEAQAVPNPPCPHVNCGCTSGHCRNPLYHCCNC